ncbi:MAG: hypothetical protein A3I05_06605 [Deltaproteobacteria bacterium RIFCSPLOWO2_02_FULL_44_10]|nr:MAG: hypothetical protein A3C46_06805 [Deltaproteobacteria bacterium RIFCSPHIGHO2_02_FULL_44_16]OGQ46702.1 MAG: hypothetical protein A3I05_06605 [Deltaproteobacteria bacterium RIFCSPLOWO2_02_FULL_44_10]
MLAAGKGPICYYFTGPDGRYNPYYVAGPLPQNTAVKAPKPEASPPPVRKAGTPAQKRDDVVIVDAESTKCARRMGLNIWCHLPPL